MIEHWEAELLWKVWFICTTHFEQPGHIYTLAKAFYTQINKGQLNKSSNKQNNYYKVLEIIEFLLRSIADQCYTTL